jgi:ribosomal protein L14E/L6E/L27E
MAQVPAAARDPTWWGVAVQALVDAPGEIRHVVNFKRLTLTDFKLEIPRLASKKVVTEAFSSSGECRSTGMQGD